VSKSRIILDAEPSMPDSWRERWYMRYLLAAVVMAISLIITRFDNAPHHVGLHLTLVFGAILLASVTSGLGPGLLAAIIMIAVESTIPVLATTAGNMWLQAMDAILLALFGGALWHSRRKAQTRHRANLQLEKQILEIGDEERNRIGHDLHDGLGQHLTGISLLSETISLQLHANVMPNPAQVEDITRLVSEAVRITRDLATNLSPITLEQHGLTMALQELAETASALLGITCVYHSDLAHIEIDNVRGLHLFRIIQEAVNNSVRHGQASNVTIQADLDKDTLLVRVTDDGSGLSAKTTRNPGLGLRIMQYRARVLGASLSASRSSTSGGTVVTCRCPLQAVSRH
jgi:signal transduction histidine kinase